ncbi:GWT1-like protein [Tanacetum coccineum]|uniref:GWT1-like protein n=1 Tax=Tanacetum coccineum TaxID=301880 RepID=A0ABQ4WKU7_9ASTR
MTSLNPNKHLKEQFVSNLSGSSVLEIFVLSALFPMVILLRHTFGICKIGIRINTIVTSSPCPLPTAMMLVESDDHLLTLLVVIPYTKLIGKVYELSKIGLHHHVPNETALKKKDTSKVSLRNQRGYIITMMVDFLSIVLPMTLLCTVLSEWTYVSGALFILVLLFSVASKRHGSSRDQEEGLYSLRDYVSAYRVSMMLITCICILAVDFNIFPRRYAKTETYGTSLMDVGVGAFVFANSFVSRQARGISTMGLRSALSSTSPLLFLGFARLVSTTGVDYQVHVGEYGVHWNFFFTLAGVAVLTSVINVSPKYCGLVGSLVLLGYQVCLMSGLNSYLLSAERGSDIISQNKEGIYSIFGEEILLQCNLTYVTLILAINLEILAILMLSDYIPGGKVSLLEQAINRNLLAFFIVANLLTGLVNLSMDTLFVSPLPALLILIIYCFIICAAAAYAEYNGFKLKFW